MFSSVRRWLESAPVRDPVEQRQTVLFQIVLLFLLVAVVLALGLNGLILGPQAFSPAQAWPSLLLGLAAALSLLLLRRGHFRAAAGLLTLAILAGNAHQLYDTGIDESGGAAFIFLVGIVIAGLIIGRHALIAALLASWAIAGIMAYLELAGQLPTVTAADPQDTRAILILYFLTSALLAILVNRFGVAPREALTASLRREQELAVMLASIGDAVIAADVQGRVSFMNAVAETLTGWPSAEACGRPLQEVFHLVNEETGQPVDNPVAKVLREGKLVGLGNHTCLISRTGQETPVDDSGALIRSPDGDIIGVILVFRDVSRRKQSEQRSRRLQSVMHASARALALEDVVAIAAPEAFAALDAHSGYIALVQEGGQSLRLIAEYRLPGPTREVVSAASLDTNILTVEVIRTGQPIWIESPEAYRSRYPEFADVFVTQGSRSIFGIPLLVEGRIVGSLVATSAAPQAFTHEDRIYILAVGQQIAQALERARLYSETDEARERFEVTLASIGDGVIATDMGGSITFMNGVAERLTGWPLAEARGRPLDEVFVISNEDTGEPVGSPFAEVVRTGSVIGLVNHTVLTCRDGQRIPIDDSGAPIRHSGEMIGMILVFRDVIERREAHRRLEESLAMTRDLYETSRRLVLADTYRGILEAFVGSRYADGPARASLLLFDRPWEDEPPASVAIAATWDRRPAALDRTGETYRFSDYALGQLYRRGEPLILADAQNDPRLLQPMRDAMQAVGIHRVVMFPLTAGSLWIGMVSLQWEHTYQIAAERIRHLQSLVDQVASAAHSLRLLELESEARRAAERADQVKMRFLAMISHELRTPLTSIKGFISTLLAPDVEWGEQEEREFLEIISSESDRLADLVEQLLDLTRLQAGTLSIQHSRQSLDGIVQNVLPQLMILTHQHDLAINVPQDLPPVYVDPTRIAQVLTNLVHNAVRYAPPHTLIAIDAEHKDHADMVEVRVRDHGPGVPPEHWESIFQAFHQVSRRSPESFAKGAGLGLAISRGLIEAQGGAIWVAEHDGPGAVFAFTLPVAH